MKYGFFCRKSMLCGNGPRSFAVWLSQGTALAALNDELVCVVRETMQLEHVSMCVRPDTSPEAEHAN